MRYSSKILGEAILRLLRRPEYFGTPRNDILPKITKVDSKTQEFGITRLREF